jgi:hypothetical protein
MTSFLLKFCKSSSSSFLLLHDQLSSLVARVMYTKNGPDIYNDLIRLLKSYTFGTQNACTPSGLNDHVKSLSLSQAKFSLMF